MSFCQQILLHLYGKFEYTNIDYNLIIRVDAKYLSIINVKSFILH